MQKISRIMGMLVSSFFFGVLPTGVFAALVPCATKANSAMCKLCDLFRGIQNIINWLMGILALVALVILVAAAIMYIVSAGNHTMIENAKSAIKNTLFGFVIVLLAWLIINVVFFVLPTDAKYKDHWWSMTC